MLSKQNNQSRADSTKYKGQSKLGQTQLAALVFLFLVPVSLIFAQNVSDVLNNTDFLNLSNSTLPTFFENISVPTTLFPELTPTTLFEPISDPTTSTETTLPVFNETTTTVLPTFLSISSLDRLTRGKEHEFVAVYSGPLAVKFVWILPEGFSLLTQSDSCVPGSCESKAKIAIAASATLGGAKVRVEAK